MGAPPARPPDWCGVSAAVSMVPLARRNRASLARMAVGHLRSRRAARWGRLVDGGLGPRRASECVALSARVSSDARLHDLCADRMDDPALAAAAADQCSNAAARDRDR